jgi:pyruvate ferredoxin oxidoreductase beta subunit
LRKKAKKALETKGPSFLLVFQPCTNVWKFPISDYVKVGKLATETNYWPLYEIENGNYVVNMKVENPKKIEEYLKTQRRFKHLFSPENKALIKDIQGNIDSEWGELIHKVATD